MSHRPVIFWFRQDLRLLDNPGLYHAAKAGNIMPIYILDDVNADAHALGGASRVWLHYALQSLNNSLSEKLSIYHGDPREILPKLCQHYDVQSVFWNRCYEPWRMHRDQDIKKHLVSKGIRVESHNASLLWEPWQVKKLDNTPYRVFTPFYKKGCLGLPAPRLPYTAVTDLNCIQSDDSLKLDALGLLPEKNWYQNLVSHWQISESGAQQCWSNFLEVGMQQYKVGRNLPAKPYVSKLSPYLHFGQISPHQIWHAAQQLPQDSNVAHFCSELGWREFSNSQLYFNPSIPTENLQKKFDRFPWQFDSKLMQAWQKGETGIPFVDAGMRELWQTGYMHNRVRMVVGSFLVKNLGFHWQHGAAWFWDCLFDADLANNSASWQWVAGCGADAAPYFRIFNPVTQGEKFDPGGEYTRQYVPELRDLPDKFLFQPWLAPQLVLDAANITLGRDYPYPIVDLKTSRNNALAAFKSISGES